MTNDSMMTKEQELIAEAVKRFEYCVEDEREIRADAIDDMNFSVGDQWDEKVRSDRERDERPCLVINKVNQPINLVVNDGKQNRPRIKVKPVDNRADKKTAEVINGLLRHIQNQSDSQIAFDCAFEAAVRCGRGFWRIKTEYEAEDTFNQKISICRIENPFSVYFPISECKEPSYRDAKYCFVSDWMTIEEIESKYPDVDISEWPTTGEGDSLWHSDERGYRVVEYFKVETTEGMLYLLNNGKLLNKLADGDKEMVVNKRKTYQRSVKRYLLCANAILEEAEFVGNYIPIIPVLGAELNIDGKKKYLSLIRFAKDPNRMYNYWTSCETEMVALAPKTPWVGAAGQFKGFEKRWAQANRKNFPYLEYQPVNAFGQLAPAPQRQFGAQVPSGMVNAIREASDNIKSTMGIYDASMGAGGQEKSGIAINARKKQGDLSNFHFYDNLSSSLEFGGRVIVDMIPHIIDTERTIRILGEDSKEELTNVNGEFVDPKTGKPVLYDLTTGQYDVVVTTGASYQTKREESAQLLIQMIQANPSIAPITADLLAEFADAPSEVVERLRKAVPNGLADDNEEEGGLDPKAQQIMQAMQQQLQILEQAFQKVVAELEKSQAQLNNRTADLKTKVYIEEMKIRADLEMAKMKLYGDRKAQQTELRGEIAESASDKQVSPEAIAELAAFLQATSNRLANLEEMLGQSEGSEEVDESASPAQSGAGEGEMEVPEPSPVG